MDSNPLKLITICCDVLIPQFENYAKSVNSAGIAEPLPIFQALGGLIGQKLLIRAIENANRSFKENTIWKREWNIFYAANTHSAVISWDVDVIHTLQFCQDLIIVIVVHCVSFNVSLLSKLPTSVVSVIFEEKQVVVMEDGGEEKNWLAEAETILKSLTDKKIPSSTNPGQTLTEIYLGSVPANVDDIQNILKMTPGLKILRHYQMVKSLYEMHVEEWKKGGRMPAYKLKNLDADFSHVVRCRMSPGWVLSPDAFLLATKLCPQAEQIHLRFDCSTPNDVLNPLLNLPKLKVFSAVCVTSGERSLLDFSDMSPVLEKFGPIGLQTLELKVIEEVEIHVVIEQCTKLQTLILSGCGYVTPPTCGSYECSRYRPGTFAQLKHLFFADGDDFSWDHGVPECFWRAALLPAGKATKPRLEGLFLEYPRIPESLTREIFKRGSSDRQLAFPQLKVASLCRYGEISPADVTAMCGLESEISPPPIQFIRVSNCELFDQSHEKQLRNWFKQKEIDCYVHVDGCGKQAESARPYTFKIYRPR